MRRSPRSLIVSTVAMLSFLLAPAIAQQQLGRNWQSNAASRTVQLISEGKDYGKHNLNQLDLGSHLPHPLDANVS